MRRAITIGVVLAVALTGLVGCGASAPAGPAPAARLYPFDSAVYYTAAEQRRIDHLVDTAVGACMRSRGYTYRSPSIDFESQAEPANPYGLLDPATVGRTGYGVVPAVVNARRPPAPEVTEPGYATALDGTTGSRVDIPLPGAPAITIARDGCEARARAAALGADWDRLYYTVQSLSNTVITTTMSAPAVTAATGRWSACMLTKGYHVASLDAAPGTIQKGAESATSAEQIRAVARTELTMATADAACQRRAGLRSAVEQAQKAAELRVLTPGHRRDLAAFRRLKRDALAG